MIKIKVKDFSFRIEEDLLKKLHYIAKYYDRSANRELLRLVRGYVYEFEKENGKIEVEDGEKPPQP